MLDHKNIVKNIALLDLKAQFASIRDEVMAEVSRICDNQTFILGAPVAKLEEEIAAYSGAKFGIGCASGSDAILLALKALGVGPGDEVLTVPFTFFATAGYIVHSGATISVKRAFSLDRNECGSDSFSRPC